MSEKLNRFVGLMKSIFELDKSDLDFGIYRIMNIRKDEIEKFLSEGLPQKVQEILAPFASNTGDIEKRLAEIRKTCDEVGVDVENSKMADEYANLKSQLAAGVDLSALETDVYSALYSFFNRYYDEGDFISKRRYKEGVYAIPYEGEEVKLYWANQDQYYIKTAENFKDYTFIDNGRKVHFRLVDATTEQNNNKETNEKKRVFMLYEETAEQPEIKTIEEVEGELIIRFVFDIPEDKKVKWVEENFKRICAAIATDFKGWNNLTRNVSSDPKKTKWLIEKHLEAYVAKNTFDYFIHKDLRGFMSRELDFYIKSEVIHLDDLDTTDEKRADNYLAKVRAIKRVGKIIIDFLAQIEDFQKKLWLKKKFVVSTDWCITLDKIEESFWGEMVCPHPLFQPES
jgi:adenine-specific DNA-methyltransferase